MTFAEYLVLVAQTKNAEPEWRMGQTYFNVLFERRDDLSEEIRGGKLDPFHNDQAIPAFLSWASDQWDRASSERMEFEKWAIREGIASDEEYLVAMWSPETGSYGGHDIQEHWELWQEAWAASQQDSWLARERHTLHLALQEARMGLTRVLHEGGEHAKAIAESHLKKVDGILMPDEVAK